MNVESYVPAPPSGLPPSHLRQPKLKNPDKFIVNQLIYFHYNIQEHSMYVSPYPQPTHSNIVKPPIPPMQVAAQFPRSQRCLTDSPVNTDQIFTKKGVLFPPNHHNKKMQHQSVQHPVDPSNDFAVHASVPIEPYPHPSAPYNNLVPINQAPPQYVNTMPGRCPGSNSQLSTSFDDPNYRNAVTPHPPVLFRLPPPTAVQQPFPNLTSIPNQSQINRFSANVSVIPTNNIQFIPPQ